MVDGAEEAGKRDAKQTTKQPLWASFWSRESPVSRQPHESEAAEAELNLGSDATWVGEFPLRRGGIVVFTLSPLQPFSIALLPSSSSEEGGLQGEGPSLVVRVSPCQAELVLHRGANGGQKVLARSSLSKAGYSRGRSEAFWLSLSPDDGCLKYGKGSRMLERTFLQYDFGLEGRLLTACDRNVMAAFFDLGHKEIQLHNYSSPLIVESTFFEAPLLSSRAAASCRVSFDESPLASDPSPRLLDNRQMILSDFAQEDFTFPANLSSTLQGLSEKILQPWLSLESIVDSNGGVLRDAIRHSLETPGLTLHKRLQEKMQSLPAGVAKSSAQLSIALGPSQGNSPGPPVTLEIIPPGHCSAPHDNARACGVLRMLHGRMDVLLFDEDLAEADEAAPLDEVEMERGDAFWFSPTWYQTHAMRNVGSSYCCYLMARQYCERDTVRWPYLQSKDTTGTVSSHRVVADMSLKEVQAIIMAELSSARESESKLLDADSELVRTMSTRTQDWVDRTDSAMDYTAYFRDGNPGSPAKNPKAHRFSCGFFRRSNLQPARDVQYLFTSPAIQEEARDLSIVWP